MKNILITGGAGFIGTNLTVSLADMGYNVVIIDDFKNAYVGHIQSICKKYKTVKYFKHNVIDKAFVINVVKENNIDAVMHLAAKKYIDESFRKTQLYFDNNMQSLDTILQVVEQCKIKNLMFASTITVYGNPKVLPITEQGEYAPICPYAETKMLGEIKIFDWAKQNPDVKVFIYRFSNPIGADIKLMLGDDAKTKSSSLVPYIIDKVSKNQPLTLNGCDHNTPDGTPIRDFIHVKDLANIVAKSFTKDGFCGVNIFNVGCGKNGYSVLQIVQEIQKVFAKTIDYVFGPKRVGDVEKIVCDNSKVMQTFDLTIEHDLGSMLSSHVDFGRHILNKKSRTKC